MREIKFRAWEEAIEHMHAGSHHFHMSLDDIGVLDHPDLDYMQFTGLKDKNGVDIYEGDIVKSYQFTSKGVDYFINHIVEWSDKFKGWFMLNSESLSGSDGSVQLWVYVKSNKYSMEVINAIHQYQLGTGF